jgi:hypothetical protein
MPLTQSIKHAKEFAIWLHDRMNERAMPANIRVKSGVAIHQQALDIGDAILLLLEARLPGPALTLARPLFEGYVRGVWLLEFASDKEINEFVNGECPKMNCLLAAIGRDAESGGAWIHANKDANWGSFNDLTHGGGAHVKRRLTQNSVEPNYPELELKKLINFGIEVRIRIGVAFLALINDEIGIEQLHDKAKGFRA